MTGNLWKFATILFFIIAVIILIIGVLKWIVGMFGFIIPAIPHAPGRLIEVAALFMIFVISFTLMNIRDKLTNK